MPNEIMLNGFMYVLINFFYYGLMKAKFVQEVQLFNEDLKVHAVNGFFYKRRRKINQFETQNDSKKDKKLLKIGQAKVK